MKFDVPSVVIDKLFSNGYEEQIVDFVMACENLENWIFCAKISCMEKIKKFAQVIVEKD